VSPTFSEDPGEGETEAVETVRTNGTARRIPARSNLQVK
jgi:hypothetical protein